MKYLMKWIKLTKTLLLIYNLAFGKKKLVQGTFKRWFDFEIPKKITRRNKLFENV